MTPRSASHARVSPDEKWLAFAATDAGETHVYLTRFPQLDETVRVSTVEGTDPQWRSDGRELYYVTLNRTLMAVSVKGQMRSSSERPFRCSTCRSILARSR